MTDDLSSTAALTEALRGVVGESHVLADDDRRAPYEVDWTGRYRGRARLVVRPADTDQVAAVLRLCHRHEAVVVPQGGNTGLVGGGVPRDGEVVLSLRRLNRLGTVDRTAHQVEAGAGVTIADLQAHAAEAGLAYAVDLAARDSATVGGTIATNAGGIRVLRFGATRNQVVGVEAVTADGRVISRMRGLVKDNTGYDLAGLLTGSEGTLAVITRALLRVVPAFDERVVAVLALADVSAAQRALARIRSAVPSLEAAEVFFAEGLDLVRRHTGAGPPFPTSHPTYLLVECAAHRDPTEELAVVLSDDPDVRDVAVATDRPGRERLWALRERHTEAISAEGIPIKLDVSLPFGAMAEFVDAVPARVTGVDPDAVTILFGHLGDGNIHVNVLGVDPASDAIDDTVLRLVVELGGSISAEHGVGRAKLPWVGLQRDSADLAATAAIKRALDPKHLLNPGVLNPG